MESVQPFQLLVILTAICACALFAHRLKLSPPIVFLLGGLALALVPGMPHVSIDPEYMLVIFLPPILTEAAFFTSIRDFRASLRPILQLAIGLVTATSVGVAGTMMGLMPGVSWALGFVLGAIISPPDAAAATSALKGIAIPKRVTTILEGESLVNDATGIVLYKFAVAAVVAGSFSFTDAGVDFLWKAIGGVVIGLACGHVFNRMYPYLREQSVEILATFIPPYAAYLLAESVHASGVLAVVASAMLIGWHAPRLFAPKMRIPAEAIWKMTVFFLNGLAFLLIGLQLPMLTERLDLYHHPRLLLVGAAICLATVIIRFVWIYTIVFVLPRFSPARWRRADKPSWQNVFLVAWTGMRGVVTLALALALPETLADGSPFPMRDEIIFLSISVIIFTLLLQGLTLPVLTRLLTLTFDHERTREEWLARVTGTRHALERIEALAKDDTVHLPALERIRAHYRERLESLGDGPHTPLDPRQTPVLMSHPLLQAENRIWDEALRHERQSLVQLRRDFAIGDDVMNDILREMDLLASRFHYETPVSVVQSTTASRRSLWLRRDSRAVA
ncbi:MAG: Na+/H+ antiporter [Rickettsiales bacterium]